MVDGSEEGQLVRGEGVETLGQSSAEQAAAAVAGAGTVCPARQPTPLLGSEGI